MNISLSELSEVKGIGKKTIQRIREYKLADEGYISEYDKSLHLNKNSINQGDCLELMNGIPDKSVDMILADLPYGTTACSWDSVIDLDKLWSQYERIIKDDGVIVLTANISFSNTLINSNKKMYKYKWIWDKVIGVNFMNVNKMPNFGYEEVLVFYNNLPTYNPQMEDGEPYKDNREIKERTKTEALGSRASYIKQDNKGERYPRGIIEFSARNNNPVHPTQKPVKLFEYLIKTYTNKGDIILDNVAGSGTTGVACQNTNRDYILIEQEEKYIDIIKERLEELDD